MVPDTFDGEWFLDTRSVWSLIREVTYQRIHLVSNELEAFPGILGQIRNPTGEELSSTVSIGSISTSSDGRLQVVAEGVTMLLSVNAPKTKLFLDVLSNGVVIQSIYRSLTEDPPSLDQDTNRPEEVDWTRSDKILEYYTDAMNKNFSAYPPLDNPIMHSLSTSGYSLKAVYETAGKLLNGIGIVRQVEIRDIIIGPQFTTVVTVGPHHFNPGSKVRLTSRDSDSSTDSSCGGGRVEYDLDPIFMNNLLLPRGFVSPETQCGNSLQEANRRESRRFSFNIPTLQIRESESQVCNATCATAVHKSLTGHSEYRDLLTATFEVMNTMGTHTHESIRYLMVRKDGIRRIANTYEEIVEEIHKLHIPYELAGVINVSPLLKSLTVEDPLSIGGNDNIVRVRYNSRSYGPNAALFYTNAQENYSLNLNAIQVNDRFGINPLHRRFSYNIVRNNYLLHDTVREIFWRLTGPVTTAKHSWPTLFGYPNNGSQFEFTAASIRPGVEWQPLFQPTAVSNPFFGLIRPQHSSGTRIGYICMKSFLGLDPRLFMLDPDFNPSTDPYHNIKDLLATMMTYMNSLKIKGLILDTRFNIGGYLIYQHLFSSLFGGLRNGFTFVYPQIGNLYRAPRALGDSTDSTIPLRDTSVFQTIDPTSIESEFPGSTYTGRKLHILTSFDSVDDLYIHGLVGDNLDRKLGLDTRAIIVGTIDGRINGVLQEHRIPTNKGEGGPIVITGPQGPVNIAPFKYSTESSFLIQHIGEGGLLSRLQDYLKPQILLRHDWSIVHRDLGFTERRGVHSDRPETWQDTWLSIAIQDASDTATTLTTSDEDIEVEVEIQTT